MAFETSSSHFNAMFEQAAKSTERLRREDLQPFLNFESPSLGSVDLMSFNFKPETGKVDGYLLLDGEDDYFGTAYIRLRFEDSEVDEIVISNIEIRDDRKRRQGVGTAMVDSLLKKYPNAKVRGENPNENALAWHKKLERVYPSRMIKFTEEERRRALMSDDISESTTSEDE